MLIYKATDTTNGKVYVGQTKNTLTERKNQHLQASNSDYFHNALRKRPDAFLWEIIEDGIPDKETLNERERYWIEYYHSYEDGYNSTVGGDGVIGISGEDSYWYGKHHSSESIKKICANRKGKGRGANNAMALEKNRKKVSKAKIGHKMPDSVKQSLYLANKGRKFSEERKREMSLARMGEKNAFYGKKHSQETIAKIRAVQTRRILVVETGDIYQGQVETAKALGCSNAYVSTALLHGWKVKDFHIRYIDEDIV